MFSLQLAWSVIKYSADDIPDPPALMFVCDLAKLDHAWDDSLQQWDNSSPLRIKDNSIAIIHWPKIYRYTGTKQWSGIKQRWFEWKVSFFPPLVWNNPTFLYSHLSPNIKHWVQILSGLSIRLMVNPSLSLVF